MRVSLLMMAKNVAPYLGAALQHLQAADFQNWELILVDDHSTDHTKLIAESYARTDSRIKVFLNPSIGKVDGTSFAYSQCSGDFVKCIDSDDVLLPAFFNFTVKNFNHDAFAHSSFVVDEALRKITVYHPSSAWFTLDYEQVTESLISFPKFSWYFSREIAEKLFPLPSHLPFEDVWMSLLIKKHSKNPRCLREPLYLYRQHSTQTFGGILNYSREAVAFRAHRVLRLIDILQNEPRVAEELSPTVFCRARKENMFLSDALSSWSVLADPQLRSRAHRLYLIRYFPRVASLAARVKWRFEAMKFPDGNGTC